MTTSDDARTLTETRATRRPRKTAAAPPRKSTRPPASETDQDKPLPGALDLDALEREGRPEPFAFIHNNRQYILADPQDQDWQQLLVVMSNPLLFLRLVLREEDRDAFFENSMPAWKLNALTTAYREHYGLPSLGEASGLSV
jgi:hypothetical protein